MPTSFVKERLDVMFPTVTRTLNLSFGRSVFPSALKSARLDPLLKESTRDPEQFKRYRGASSLLFVSKVIEKDVALRFTVQTLLCYVLLMI